MLFRDGVRPLWQAARGEQALDIDAVFGERQVQERFFFALCARLAGGLGGLARGVIVGRDDGVELGVVAFDAPQVQVEQFDG